MKDSFLIGEVSKLFQLDIRTLRYYDKIHLFKPKYVDEHNGYRYYTIDQFEQLNTILYLKSLHVPLKDIKEFLENRDVDNILFLLEKQKIETEKRLYEISQVQRKIDKRIEQIKDATHQDVLYRIREHELPERVVVYLKQNIYMKNDFEMLIRVLENNANMKSAVFLGKVGFSIAADNLKKRMFNEYNSIFIIVDAESYRYSEARTLSKGIYLSIRFEGTHEDASPYYDQLIDYIEKNQYEIVDDAIEITLIDYGFTNDKSKFVTEIQIPITKSLTL
ncbi:MerR family transcriptional regulator [Bacillus massiliigorillae]|uniref:MerR family transcriptional regulator n=1 Tax=Bacillus massiliigorillae TaxID=1243664 RepID=UPI0003A344D2|nr:MerR family transcriptional regulator [Bacillus massiliigorillae]